MIDRTRCWITAALFVAMIGFFTRETMAQPATVQQPVVGGFSAATTVSVPDRGIAHLGSVGSASSGRITSGAFRPGTSMGQERSASSMSVSVYIHDLQAMDEALLAQGTGSVSANDNWSPRLAERRAASIRGGADLPLDDKRGKAARYEQLARDAEAKRKLSTARLHWQMAAKLGSTTAHQRLAALVP